MLDIDDLFQGRHFDREIIILCVRWYLRFKLSFRDLVEMMAGAQDFSGPYDDQARDPALYSGIRKALEPLRMPSWRFLAGRRNLREDQGPLDLPLSRGGQRGKDGRFSAPRQAGCRDR